MTSAHHLLVGHPPTLGPLDQFSHPICVGHLVGRTPKIMLSHVPVQVLDRDVVVGAIDRPLQLAKERLDRVGREAISYVLTSRVVDPLVLGEERPGEVVEIGRASCRERV